MSAEASLTELERPPTYASVEPTHHTIDVNHQTNREVTFDTLPASDGHTYEIYNSNAGLNVTNAENRQLFYIGRYEAVATPDLIVYGGYGQQDPQLALVQFTKFEKDFKIYLGSMKHPTGDDWDTVRCATEGRFFQSDLYRFEVSANTAPGAQHQKRKLHWRKTHDAKLGASKLSVRDFKLVDEGSNEVVAVYIEHNLGTPGKLKSKIEYKHRLGETAELAALAVVMALVERMRRHLRQGGRAAPGWVIK